MNSQFTIRLSDATNKKTIERAKTLGITRATLVRNAITSYVTNPNPNKDSEIVAVLKEQLSKANLQIEAANEAKSRSDTIIMQLTKQLEHSQLQLENLTKPKTFIQRLKTVFN